MSNPKIKSTIVACTAAVQASERQKAEESGMTEFVAKPVSRDKVKKILGIFVR
jgi:CheY-like chemotaxis protein